MVTVDETDEGLLRIANGAITLDVATAFGPRIVSCALVDQPNVLAHLPDAVLPWRPGRDFRLRGGHRLWIAPEVPDATYVPDDEPVTVSEDNAVVSFESGPNEWSRFGRRLVVELHAADPIATVTHQLRYDGDEPIVAAPWAITMLRPGGDALLPLAAGDQSQFQACRSIVLWPYTTWHDPLLEITDDAIIVRRGRSSPTKIGTNGSAGWGAYLVDGVLFTKSFTVAPSLPYADLGASLQCYANAEFCELETLGPLTHMTSGQVVEHVETWRLSSLADSDETALTIPAGRLRSLLA